MEPQYFFKSKFFLVFIAISAMAFSALPVVHKSFAEASDSFVKSSMHRVQAELFFYDLVNIDLRLICIGPDVNMLHHSILVEKGAGLSCNVDAKAPSISFYTTLKREEGIYCVDTLGFQGVIDGKQPPLLGRCSK